LKTATSQQGARHGRGTGVPDPVDVHVGNRLRTRRLLIGMNQEALARRLGLTFQQVQKYESGANRVSASRLKRIADVLAVKVGYFFIGLQGSETELSPEETIRRELMQRPETLELVRLYYKIADQRVRSQFLEMVKAVAQTSHPAE
jgi:transcriptional regulator with XRE-family HTH domain